MCATELAISLGLKHCLLADFGKFETYFAVDVWPVGFKERCDALNDLNAVVTRVFLCYLHGAGVGNFRSFGTIAGDVVAKAGVDERKHMRREHPGFVFRSTGPLAHRTKRLAATVANFNRFGSLRNEDVVDVRIVDLDAYWRLLRNIDLRHGTVETFSTEMYFERRRLWPRGPEQPPMEFPSLDSGTLARLFTDIVDDKNPVDASFVAGNVPYVRAECQYFNELLELSNQAFMVLGKDDNGGSLARKFLACPILEDGDAYIQVTLSNELKRAGKYGVVRVAPDLAPALIYKFVVVPSVVDSISATICRGTKGNDGSFACDVVSFEVLDR